MSLTFAEPWWLLLTALAVPLGIIGLKSFGAMTHLRRWSAVVLRAVLLALLGAMLAGASAVRTSDRMAVIAVVDISSSVREFAGAFGDLTIDSDRASWEEAVDHWLREASRDRTADDLLGLVVFDGSQLAIATPTSGAFDRFALDARVAEGTDIEAALRYAQALFPPGARRRMVLISDGNQTSGDALAAASAAAAAGIPIDVLPVRYEVRGEVMVDRVDVPPSAAREAEVTLRVALRATDPATGTLEVRYEGQPLDLSPGEPGTGMRVELARGLNVIPVGVPLQDRAVHRLEPVFFADDQQGDRIARNNRGEAFVVTPGEGQVLLIDGAFQGEGGPLATILSRQRVEYEIVTPDALPTDLLAMQGYDLIMLQDIAADEVPQESQLALAEYVQTLGGGLVMIGGTKSFGAGGWNNTEIEAVLPVELDLPEQLITPQAAIAFVIDRSGSMAGNVLGGARTQLDIATAATALAIETLDKTDLVTVIAFDDGETTVVPLAPNSNPQTSASAVRRIMPGGGTNMYPAIAEAGRRLMQVDAQVKHVIVLSDGQSTGQAQMGIANARRLANNDVTVSTIAVGDGADRQTLSSIAREGGGAFYDVYDPNQLPRIFVKEIRVVRRPMIREGNFTPAWTGAPSSLLGGIENQPIPPLGGLVLTQPKPDAKATIALATPEGEPVLAHWFAGRGRVAAFTSDASAWASDWLDWSGYETMWSSIVRAVARPALDSDLEVVSEVEGDELILRVDAFERTGAPIDALAIEGFVVTPSGQRQPVTLEQDGPGSYSAAAPALEQGSYVVVLQPSRSGEPMAPVVSGAARALGPEYRALDDNTPLMQSIAGTSGGRVLNLDLPQRADLWNRGGLPPNLASEPLWRTLLIWTLIILLLDIATRRVAWDRWVTGDFAEELRAAANVRARADRAASTLAGLKGSSRKPAPQTTPSTSQPRPARATPGPSTSPSPAASSTDRATAAEPADADEKQDDQPADRGQTSAGLLAAKRRAQQRYSGNDSDTH